MAKKSQEKKSPDKGDKTQNKSPEAVSKDSIEKKEIEPPLEHIDFEGIKYPLKEMFMKFLEHPDSIEQTISDEIILNFPESPLDSQQSATGTPKQKREALLSCLCPTTFVIHETFPILLLQDSTHFASFCLTKELYEQIKEKQISTQYFSEMAQYSLKVEKVRIQLRRVSAREVFTSYMGLEIRIIITQGEISQTSLKSGMVDSRKNWWMRSLYRDDDIRTLIQNKFHNRMQDWVDKEPEFDQWPTGFNYFTEDKTIRFDKTLNCVIQPEINKNTPEDGETVKLKPDNSRDLYFDCMKEAYPPTLQPYDCEDILVFEKGQRKYDDMLQNRKDAEEKRKMTSDIIMNTSKIFVKNGDTPFNTEEERRRTQERQQQRQNRNEIKEMAEQVKIQFFQLQSWQKHFKELQVISDEKAAEIQRRSRRSNNAPVPPRLHLNHTKRYIQWFRQNIINDPLVNQNQIEKNKMDQNENLQREFSDYYINHDFNLTIIQRTGSIANGYIGSIHVPSTDASANTNNISLPSQPITKRVTADPKIETKPQPLAPKNVQKFGIGKKVQKQEENKGVENQEDNDDEGQDKEILKEEEQEEEAKETKKPVIGMKRKTGGLIGLGGSLNKKQKT